MSIATPIKGISTAEQQFDTVTVKPPKQLQKQRSAHSNHVATRYMLTREYSLMGEMPLLSILELMTLQKSHPVQW